ncbi:basement membrane-specific heparan sulfate proteoglycan core protein isoform X2 [Nematostella vectensis]|nr:basement membrane-specific heparan sulfate proteoglycan core protein isoform X2 [Nematostella vectensis]
MYSKTNGPEAAFKDRVMRFSMANELSNQFPVFKIYFTLTNLSSSVDGFGSKSIRCQVVRKSNGASQQRDTLLHVQVPIQNFAVHPLRLTLNETDAALFTCSADGSPSPTITWTNTQGQIVGHGLYYRIPAVNRRMSGMYTCTVTDGCGQNYTKSAILIVQYKPEKTKLIKLAPSGNVSGRYSTYVFRCIASAYPPVTSYTIYTNGTKRYTGTGIYYGYTHILGAAEFTCEPHSAAGYGANSTVTIITIVDVHHFFPFNHLSGGGTVLEGSSLSFYCYLRHWHGYITWIKNGKGMNTLTTFYELRFDPVTRKDEGFYACGYIFNGIEYIVHRITHLTVEYKPEKTQLHSLGSSYCHGSAIPLYCTAVAKPADIRYFLRINNQPLANNTIGLFNVSLRMLGYHLYTCAPSNKVGEGEHRSVRIHVQEPLTSASILPINGTRFTEKSTVQLTCAANEVNSHEIRWTKDGVLVGEGQTLMIQSINRTDEGVYTCTINNTCNVVSAVTYIGVDYVNMDQQTLKCSSFPGFIILSLETNTAPPPNITCNNGHASYRGLVAHSSGSVISYRVDLPDPDVSEVKCRAEGFPGTENTYTIAVADSEYIRNGSFRVTNARYPPSDAIKGKIIKSIKECFDAACLRSLSVTYRDGSLVVDVSLVITANITNPFLSVKDTLLHKTKFYGLSVDPSSIEMSALAYLPVTKLEKRSDEVVNQEPAVSGLAVMVALLFVSNCATIIYFLKCKKSGTEERPRPNVDGREKNSQTQSITMQEGPFSSLHTEGQAGAQPGGSCESMGQLSYSERNASPEYDTVTPTKTVTQHNQAHVTRPKIFSKRNHESSTSLSRANTPLKQLHNTKAIKEKIEKPGHVTMAANDVTASTGARDQEPSAMYQSLDSVFVNEAQYASLTPHTRASTDHMAFVYENLGRDSAKETDFCHHLDVDQQESSHANATTA